MKGSLAALRSGIAVLLLVSSCTSEPKKTPLGLPAAPLDAAGYTLQAPPPYLVGDHKRKSESEDPNQPPPQWVNQYIAAGIAGLEAMPEFQNYYVFVDEVGGPNKGALQQWLAGYRVNQDIGRLIAIRAQNRFIRDSEGFPDRTYGRYFEYIIRAVSDSSYPEARRAEDYWILKRFPPQNNEGIEAGEYRFFILILITRGALEGKLRSLFLQYKTLGKPDRLQLAAINRISDTFFANF